MDIQITHLTRYNYDREVQLLPHLLYLRPRENPLLQIRHFNLHLRPEARLDWMRDDFDNLPASVQFSTMATTLEIRSECLVTTSDAPPFDFLVRDYAAYFPFDYEPLHRGNLAIYLAPPDGITRDGLRRWLDERFRDRPRETVPWIFALNQLLCRCVSYRRREQPGIQSTLATLALGSGSCRDLAVVLIDCARTVGLAARFVSGYMLDAAADDAASGAMHAWAEIFLPGAGWRGLDPTHGIFCNNAYVPVAHAVVAQSVNPVQGAFFSMTPARAVMTTEVQVREARQPTATAPLQHSDPKQPTSPAADQAGNTPSRHAGSRTYTGS